MALYSDLARSWTRILGLGLLMLALVSRAHASSLAISFCSPDLTASGFQAVYNMYQTVDTCSSTCGGYAYVVLQGSDCWCSNYAPEDQVSTYSCNTVCPGWPDDWCGNTQEGLYGYFQMPGSTPSGTAGGSSLTSASSPSVSKTPSSAGSSTASPLVSSVGRSSSLTEIATAQSSSQASMLTAGTSSAVPVVVSQGPDPSSTSTNRGTTVTRGTTSLTQIYTSVTTVTGQVRTILVTPTSTADSTPDSGTIKSSGGGVHAGEVAGIVVGVALALGIAIGLVVWICLRRRHRRNLESASIDNASSHRSAGIPSRQVSQMSSAGLLSKAPKILTTGLPSYNHPQSADSMGDRRSVGTDQRLNPYAIYAHDESRHSNVSLQDNQDYSRQLRVANPDP